MSRIQKIKQSIRKIPIYAGAVIVAAVTAFGGLQPSVAASYPEKPVTLIVPFQAGGSTETMAQVFAKALGESLGQKVVVVTRPGAGGAIGSTFLSNAPADGYTLMLTSIDPLTWIPLTSPDIEYRLDSFRYIAAITEYQQAIVTTPDKPYQTFQELIEYAKKNPGMNIADQGGLSKAFVEYIAKKAGVEWTPIPTKGGGEMIPFLLGGKVDIAWSGGVHAKYGDQIKVLASCNADRLAASPDAPAIKELYGVSMPGSTVIVAPAGTPDDVAAKVEGAVKKAMDDPAFEEILSNLKFPKKYIGSKDLGVAVDDIINSLKMIMAQS